jgi:hypothetical protein
MNIVEKIMKDDKKSKRFLGLEKSKIEMLTTKMQPLWESSEKARLSRPGRQRAIGAGHPYFTPNLIDLLVVCLMYYKLYLTQEFVAVIFGIDQGTVSRIVSKISTLIEDAADPELKMILQKTEELKKHRIKNFIELADVCPDLADIMTDATESPCNRPTDNDVQKKYYSGKQKTHTIKTQLTINSNKRIVAVSETHPGSVHDKQVFDSDETIKKLPQQARHILDKGYVGVDKEHPNCNILIPFKRKKGQEKLPPLLADVNKYLSSRRISVEHVIGKLKNFRISAYTYRGRREKFNQVIRNLAAIYNFSRAAA